MLALDSYIQKVLPLSNISGSVMDGGGRQGVEAHVEDPEAFREVQGAIGGQPLQVHLLHIQPRVQVTLW